MSKEQIKLILNKIKEYKKITKLSTYGITFFVITLITASCNNDNVKDKFYKLEKSNKYSSDKEIDTSLHKKSYVSSYAESLSVILENQQEQQNFLSNETINYNNQLLKEYIYKYCEIYNIKYNLAYEIASNQTNNFKSNSFIYNNNIDGTRVYKDSRKFKSLELGVLSYIRHLSQIPEDFGYSKLNIYKENNYTDSKNYEETIKYYSDLIGISKELILAIVYSESGVNLDGPGFVNRNNPGNLIGNTEYGFREFDNKEQGIIELILTIKYKYFVDMNLENSDMLLTIKSIQKYFCPEDDPKVKKSENINKYWLENVTNLYLRLENDYYYYSNNLNKKIN